MFKELKKRSILGAFGLTWMWILLGVGLIAYNYKEIKMVTGVTRNFNKMSTAEIVSYEYGKVEAIIDDNYGKFMQGYSQTDDRSNYFLIQNKDGDDTRYMAVELPVIYDEQMALIEDATYKDEPVLTIDIKGILRKMSPEEEEFFKACFVENTDYTSEEYKNVAIPYVITYRQNAYGVDVLVMCALGFLFILGSFLFILLSLFGSRISKFKKQVRKSAYSQEEISSDYDEAGFVSSVGDFKIGKLATYNSTQGIATLIDNKEIAWVYEVPAKHVIEHKLRICTIFNKIHKVDVYKEDVDAILEYYRKHMPWIITEYSPESKEMYKKNMDMFLNIKYKKNSLKFVEDTPLKVEDNQ